MGNLGGGVEFGEPKNPEAGRGDLNRCNRVEAIQSKIEHSRRRGKYDARTGVPAKASIDWLKNAIDDEYSWTVTDFQQFRRAG